MVVCGGYLTSPFHFYIPWNQLHLCKTKSRKACCLIQFIVCDRLSDVQLKGIYICVPSKMGVSPMGARKWIPEALGSQAVLREHCTGAEIRRFSVRWKWQRTSTSTSAASWRQQLEKCCTTHKARNIWIVLPMIRQWAASFKNGFGVGITWSAF